MRQGWFRDPHNPLAERWWDGQSWTEFTRDMPPGALAEPLPDRQRVRPAAANARNSHRRASRARSVLAAALATAAVVGALAAGVVADLRDSRDRPLRAATLQVTRTLLAGARSWQAQHGSYRQLSRRALLERSYRSGGRPRLGRLTAAQQVGELDDRVHVLVRISGARKLQICAASRAAVFCIVDDIRSGVSFLHVGDDDDASAGTVLASPGSRLPDAR